MNKIRRWLNKPKKEVENMLMIQPLTPGRTHVACDDFTVTMETWSSAPQRLATPLSDLKLLDSSLISQTRTYGSDPDVLLTTRLSILRDVLQGETTLSPCSAQTSAPLPVCSPLQVKQVTGDRKWAELMDTVAQPPTGRRPMMSQVPNTPANLPGLPVRSSLKTRDDFSLPSSPHSGGSGRLPSSLPCSPLLGGRRWRSSPSPASPPSGLSRLWVEAALQRSKQLEPRPPPARSPQVRQEGEEELKSRGRKREDDDDDEDKQVAGIRLSDTVIFRPMTSPSTCGRKGKEEEEEEEEEDLCLDSETSRYCLLTPCVCSRCPSAPPYEAEVFPAGCNQPVSSFSSEDQRHNEALTPGTNVQTFMGGSEQTSSRHRAPHLGESSGLYPCLSLWKITADSQTGLYKKREEEVNACETQLNQNTIQTCSHGNSTDDHLLWFNKMIPDGPAELQTLCSADQIFILKKVFDSTTCSKRTSLPVESCSFCSDNLSVQVMKHFCRNCDQVFCHRCLCHFESLLQIHQFIGV